jgi:predicted porin
MAALVVLAGLTSAEAATITNKDKSAVTVAVVENGNRMDMPLAPGASQSFCPAGCFITAPNGDRLGLSGNEDVEISGGAAIVK